MGAKTELQLALALKLLDAYRAKRRADLQHGTGHEQMRLHELIEALEKEFEILCSRDT